MNIRYKHACLIKTVLIVVLLVAAVLIATSQNIDEPITPAEVYARVCEESEPWTEPTPIPGISSVYGSPGEPSDYWR